ncbi:MAG TPA: Gfo/Idh/MocA family oxidoreductase [Candidatus Hydrogenedentes bacterium]|nr:Gfo/Idh/MocA family oxidoreductase [Candidatus Hydrogenedentota bacterium]
MSDTVSRRNFMKAAGATAGVAIATGYSPFSYAQNEKVRVGCIGTGGQGSYHVRDGLLGCPDVDIVAVCDVYRPHQENGFKLAWLSNAGILLEAGDTGLTAAQQERLDRAVQPARYFDYREMLAKEQLDAVVIATPLHTHYQMIMDALSSGCHVFSEKTMCYEIDQARDVVKKSHETGKFVQVGHQRRYNPLYNRAVNLAWNEGVLGRVNHIDCQWHRNNDWRRPLPDRRLSPQEAKFIRDLEKHLNWRLYNESSRGLMTELATHQLDIASWFLDAMPKRVYGYGGLDYWRDGREVDDHVNVIYEYEITPESRGYYAINARNDQQDKLRINEPYKVCVVYSSITANAKKGCSELIQGDEGSFELTEDGGYFFREPTSKVKWASSSSAQAASQQNATVITSGGTLQLSNKAQQQGDPIVVDNTKSIDQLQFQAFAYYIRNGGAPKSNVMVGLRSTILGLAGYIAMAERREVEIDPAWYTFDFPTPDPSVVS